MKYNIINGWDSIFVNNRCSSLYISTHLKDLVSMKKSQLSILFKTTFFQFGYNENSPFSRQIFAA